MNTQTVGVSGEFFVAAELSRRGFIANITLRNAHAVDVFITRDELPGKSISIQVKAKTEESPEWIMTEKGETISDPKLFYVFVRCLRIDLQPLYHVVPSHVVSLYCKKSHAEWLTGLKRDGTSRKDSTIRKYRDLEHEYLNQWDQLVVEIAK